MEKGLRCDPMITNKLPTRSYFQMDRSITCSCTLESDLAYVLPDVGACGLPVNNLPFTYTPNLAFDTIMADFLNYNSTPPKCSILNNILFSLKPPHEYTFAVTSLSSHHNLSTSIALLQAFLLNLSSSKRPPRVEIKDIPQN